jgi:anti-sigma B factor antagonist
MEIAMDFEVTEYKRCAVIHSAGRIDSYTAPEFEAALNQLMEKGFYNIILDMSDVNFVSSAGWWAMIRVQKEVHKLNRGELVLVNLDERIQESMDLVGIRQYFTIHDELLEAVANF